MEIIDTDISINDAPENVMHSTDLMIVAEGSVWIYVFAKNEVRR